jgi:Cu/Ag efflux protein CusF
MRLFPVACRSLNINQLVGDKTINLTNKMKTTRAKYWAAVGAAVLTAIAAFRASADQPATAAKPEKSYTGTVVSVDPQEQVLSVKSWLLSEKAFNLGDKCAYTLLDKNDGTANDLRPGQKVTISYQESHGVLIADRVEQRSMQFEGMVTAIDPDKHTLTLHRRGVDKQMEIADGCIIVSRSEQRGTFADIQPGDHVTVTYETPGGKPFVREIAQTSIVFTGTLTAIDLGEKTVKASALFGSMKFNVADDCVIVINGKTDGHLSDLKPNDKLVFNYDEINGINVVDRIGPAAPEGPRNPPLVTSSPMGNAPGY